MYNRFGIKLVDIQNLKLNPVYINFVVVALLKKNLQTYCFVVEFIMFQVQIRGSFEVRIIRLIKL